MKKLISCGFVALAFCAFTARFAYAETALAKVGSRLITMEELQKTLNSTPYGMPRGKAIDPGSREVMGRMLGELINAELLYNESLTTKIREKADYKRETDRHRKDLLAYLYRERLIDSKIKDDPGAVKKYADANSVSIESARAMMRNEKRKKILADESSRLFDHYKVRYSPIVAKGGLDRLKDDALLVSSSIFKIHFRDIKPMFQTLENKNALLDILAQSVQVDIFAARAMETGLDKDRNFLADAESYGRDLSVALLREELINKFNPKPKEIEDYIAKNEQLRYKPRKAEILMIVTKTEAEAKKIRGDALNGGNFFELAANNSIAPNTKINVGRVGSIMIGERPYNSIDKALLAVKPGEITKPIKGDKGYSIFKLVSIAPAEIQSGAEMREQAVKNIVTNKMEKHIDELYKSTKVETYPFPSSLPE